MRLDLRSPSTYFVLVLCFLVGFFSFLILRGITLSVADSGLAENPDSASQPLAADASGQAVAEISGGLNPEASVTAASAKEGQMIGEKPTSSLQAPDEEEPEVADLAQSAAFPRTQGKAEGKMAEAGGGLVATLGRPAIAVGSRPAYEIAWADPSNYGDRYKADIYKRPVSNRPIIVLHETVGSASSVIAYFKSYHANDADQASYHTMVRRNGTVVYMVPPEKRAYGAGNSVFVTEEGQQETVKTHKKYPPSVNNFAYHISLESPPDGYGNEPAHSGYTQAQYDSLAWLIGQSTVPLNRITTHKAVDRSNSRSDPRSFEVNRLIVALRPYR